MCAKKTLYVYLISMLAMELAVAAPSLGQNSGAATEAPSGYERLDGPAYVQQGSR